jgi:RimJ/RimL family protein N-acetyltransferase
MIISRQPSDEKPWMEMYMIVLRPSSTEPAQQIGAMGILRVSEDGKAAEVGYGILATHRGKGYAPEALKLLVNYYWNSKSKSCSDAGFANPFAMVLETRELIHDLGRIQKDVVVAGAEADNLNSHRVLEKAGFVKKGILENAFQAKNPSTGEMEWKSVIEWYSERPKA